MCGETILFSKKYLNRSDILGARCRDHENMSYPKNNRYTHKGTQDTHIYLYKYKYTFIYL